MRTPCSVCQDTESALTHCIVRSKAGTTEALNLCNDCIKRLTGKGYKIATVAQIQGEANDR